MCCSTMVGKILFFLFTLSLHVNCTRLPPFNVISPQGQSKATTALKKYYRASLLPSDPSESFKHDQKPLNVVSFIDCTTGDINFVNDLLGTSFTNSINGVFSDIGQNTIVLRSCFDQVYSAEFCGAKAIEFSIQIKVPIVVLIECTRDGFEDITRYEQILCKLLLNPGLNESLLIIIKGSCELERMFKNYVTSLIDDETSQSSLGAYSSISVVVVDPSDTSSISSVKPLIHAMNGSFWDLDKFCSSISEVWNRIPSNLQPVLDKHEQSMLFDIETAYLYVLNQADLSIGNMQKRVNVGRILANFPERVKGIISAALMDFSHRINFSTLMVRERTEKARMIRDTILSGALKLLEQQVYILEIQHILSLKKDLQNLYLKSNNDVPMIDLQKLARQSLWDFKAAVALLQDDSIGLNVPDVKSSEYAVKADAIVKDFADSPEGRMLELKKIEGKLNKSQKKRKGLFEMLGVSLSIVGMLRPHGFGNLQGLLTYATSFLGLPLDFMLGLQNDGDSLEISGEDREHPLLRLQPKFNIQIDL